MARNVRVDGEDEIDMHLRRLDQRNMGMSMRVERSNVDQVRKRIELNKTKQNQVEKDYNFEERMKELKEEVERDACGMLVLNCFLHRRRK